MKTLITILILVVASYAGLALTCDSVTSCNKVNHKTHIWEDCTGLRTPTFFELNYKHKTMTITTVLSGSDVCKVLSSTTTVENGEKVFTLFVRSSKDGQLIMIVFNERFREIRCTTIKGSKGHEEMGALHAFHVRDFAPTQD